MSESPPSSSNPPLWAPWRIEYILGPKVRDTCIFCLHQAIAEPEMSERHVVHLGERAYVMLNRYPFASGHLMVLPYAHVSRLDELSDEDYDALFRLVREASRRLQAAVKAPALNVGINLGEAAGAGIAEHLHVHVVPRWPGDSNFMPVIADTRVVPQALEATRRHLQPYFDDLPKGRPPAPDPR